MSSKVTKHLRVSPTDRKDWLAAWKSAEPIQKCVEQNSEPGDPWVDNCKNSEQPQNSRYEQQTHFHKDRIFPQKIELQT